MLHLVIIAMKYSLCSLLFFIPTVFAIKGNQIAKNIPTNDCKKYSLPCSTGGDSVQYLDSSYPIRFPFVLKDSHSKNCGCSGFVLSCSSTNKTLLELPNSPSIKFVHVEHIDYSKRRILISVPNEFWGHTKLSLDNFLNLSRSPFRSSHGSVWMTLVSCPREPSWRYGCVNRSTAHIICAVPFDKPVESYEAIDCCTKIYDFKGPKPHFSSYGVTELTWLKPSCNLSHKGLRVKIIVITGSIIGSFLILVLLIATIYMYPSKEDRENQLRIKKFLTDYVTFKPSRYTYADIKKITNRFKDKLGQGTYGTVFKGKLSSDILVAVKILNCSKENSEDQFINEVAIMGQIHHVNVVRLVGYCADGLRRALVYEFFPNGSLEKYISASTSKKIKRLIGWEKFQDIAIGIAKGIEYLHQGCGQRILHFDIKPNNILLDRNFNPKISDFGLAKLCSKDKSLVSMTTARGTMGYIAPEVFSRNFGNVSYKSDVYSFGMLLLEIVGGRKSTKANEKDNNEIYYPEWIYNLLEEGEDLRIQIEEEGDERIAKKLAIVGLWCIQWHPIGRPTMKLVVQMLEGKEELSMPPNPFAGTINNTPTRRSIENLEAIAE